MILLIFISILHPRLSKENAICEQRGVFRVNCVDCLDRTNVSQTAIARIVMETQVISSLAVDSCLWYPSFGKMPHRLWIFNIRLGAERGPWFKSQSWHLMLWLYCLWARQVISSVHIQFNVCIHVYVPPLMVSQSRGKGGIFILSIMQFREKKGISNGHVCLVVLEVKAGIGQAH